MVNCSMYMVNYKMYIVTCIVYMVTIKYTDEYLNVKNNKNLFYDSSD